MKKLKFIQVNRPRLEWTKQIGGEMEEGRWKAMKTRKVLHTTAIKSRGPWTNFPHEDKVEVH
jgi:hypothetical protein